VFFAFPDYLINIRPQIAKIIGSSTLSFVEGTIFGAVITILILKFLSDKSKTKMIKQKIQ